jgi:hypothetical protein
MNKKSAKSTKKPTPQMAAPKKPRAMAAEAPRSPRKTAVPKPRTFILFGIDKDKKPRAARFVEEELGLLAKAAEAMDLMMCEVTNGRKVELASKLPAGELNASGTTFVPFIRQDLYEKVVEAAGDDAKLMDPPSADGVPLTFDDIRPGHVVVAHESPAYGWWEAIVFAKTGDTLTLRYRDYPRFPKFNRPRSAVALPCLPPSK